MKMLQHELPLPSVDQGEVYRHIRNFLAGRFVGATRDSALLEEVTKCLFCKSFLANQELSGGIDRSSDSPTKRYRAAFKKVKARLPNVFDFDAEIELDAEALTFVDQQLSLLDLTDPSRDPLGAAYEAFASSSLRQQEGQFFTPLNAVEWLVAAIAPKPGELIIDPACGAGGFLSAAARFKMKHGSKSEDLDSTSKCNFL